MGSAPSGPPFAQTAKGRPPPEKTKSKSSRRVTVAHPPPFAESAKATPEVPSRLKDAPPAIAVPSQFVCADICRGSSAYSFWLRAASLLATVPTHSARVLQRFLRGKRKSACCRSRLRRSAPLQRS